MLVTVAVCTWNRASLLDMTLGEMRKLRVPRGIEWELLVVNNNCDDNTDEIIARHSSSLPIRRLAEPKQGLSHSRNCAVREARGEIILWTDDDGLVCQEWLAEYAKAAKSRREAAFFGGPVEPLFQAGPPGWLERNLPIFSTAFALRDVTGEPLEIRPGARLPFGANMGMRKSALQDAPFDPSLGRAGGDSVSGEEAQVFRRLLDENRFGAWIPGAPVRHYIPRERASLRYVWNYYHGIGRTQVRVSQGEDDTLAIDQGDLRRRYLAEGLRALYLSPGHGERWARAFRGAAKSQGMLSELRGR